MASQPKVARFTISSYESSSEQSESDQTYRSKRDKNNEAVKKSREKSREKKKEVTSKMDALKKENNELEDQIETLSDELATLKKNLLLTVAGKKNASDVKIEKKDNKRQNAANTSNKTQKNNATGEVHNYYPSSSGIGDVYDSSNYIDSKRVMSLDSVQCQRQVGLAQDNNKKSTRLVYTFQPNGAKLTPKLINNNANLLFSTNQFVDPQLNNNIQQQPQRFDSNNNLFNNNNDNQLHINNQQQKCVVKININKASKPNRNLLTTPQAQNLYTTSQNTHTESELGITYNNLHHQSIQHNNNNSTFDQNNFNHITYNQSIDASQYGAEHSTYSANVDGGSSFNDIIQNNHYVNLNCVPENNLSNNNHTNLVTINNNNDISYNNNNNNNISYNNNNISYNNNNNNNNTNIFGNNTIFDNNISVNFAKNNINNKNNNNSFNKNTASLIENSVIAKLLYRKK